MEIFCAESIFFITLEEFLNRENTKSLRTCFKKSFTQRLFSSLKFSFLRFYLLVGSETKASNHTGTQQMSEVCMTGAVLTFDCFQVKSDIRPLILGS